MGNLVKFTDPAGGTVNYTYDIVGNRLSTTDPKGNTTSYIVDSLNRLVRTTDPAGRIAQFNYDAVGNLISRSDPNGKTTTYLYDANNRLSRISYPTGQAVTFAYDANGNRTTMTDALGTTAYAYDAQNRLSNVTDCYGNSVGYGCDANGNRTSVTYPGSKTVQYGYDAANRLTRVTDWLGNSTSYNYDADGQLTGAANSNGTAASYQYDVAGRLISLGNSAANSAIISSYQFSLDAVGNQAQVSQIALVQSTPAGGNFNYAYDNDNRLITSEGQTQSFDANGNLLSASGTNLFAYDYENRLTRIVFAGTTNVYQYDGLGNRMSASRNGALARYVLDRNSPLPPVLSETDSGGNITACYVYGLGLISRIDAGGNVRYYHFDSRGSTIALSDASGKILEAYAYDPYGKPINQINSTSRFRYLGRRGVMDEANGFLYFGSCYYATEVGRFITKASTTGKGGDSQSLNRYIYALDNPVSGGCSIPLANSPAACAEAIATQESTLPGQSENTNSNGINAAGNVFGSGLCNLVPGLFQ